MTTQPSLRPTKIRRLLSPDEVTARRAAYHQLEVAARGRDDDTPSLYAPRWLRTLLDWCRDNPLVQQAIAEDENPSAVTTAAPR